MTSWKPWAVLALFAAVAAAGCQQTRTIFCEGQLESSVQLIAVPASLQVIKPFVDRDKDGRVTRIQVQIRNASTSDTYKGLEYTVQFFNAEGREVPSTAKGWVPLVLGRGELVSISGATTAGDAVRATVTIRQQSNNG
jgi:hypothetical protein